MDADGIVRAFGRAFVWGFMLMALASFALGLLLGWAVSA